MHLPRALALAGVSGALAVSVALGVAAPAQAVTIDDAGELLDYALTVKSSQLQAASTINGSYPDAWAAKQAQLTAQTANGYNLHQTYGAQKLQDIAEIVPIANAVDHSIGSGKKLTPSGGKAGPKIPFTGAVTPMRAAIGGAGLGVAVTGYAMRGDIASGVLSWVGIDAQNAVCSADAGGFVNFLTGQDCDLWKQTNESLAIAATEILAGVRGGRVCGTGTRASDCFTLVKEGSDTGSGDHIYVFYLEGPWVTGTSTRYAEILTMANFIAGNLTYFGQNQLTASNAAGNVIEKRCANVNGGTATDKRCVSIGNVAGGLNNTELIHSYRVMSGGAVTQPIDTDTNPPRFYRCEITVTSGAVLSKDSSTWLATEAETANVVPDCPVIPSGQSPTITRIYEVAGDVSRLVHEMVPDETFTEYQQEYGELCAAQSCFLDLVQVSSGLSCFGLGAACDGWMTSPTRDTDFACQYGGRPEPVQECYAYANLFNQAKRLAGNAYADPVTGKDLGGGTSLRFDEQLMGAPVRDAGALRDCGGAGWGEPNPLQWVLLPVQCALEWAFVPREAYALAQLETAKQKFESRAPGQIAAMVGGWSLAPIATGCAIRVDYPNPFGGTNVVPIIDGCAGSPMGPLAAMSRTLTTIVMAVLVSIVVRRQAAAAFGWGGAQ